MKVIANLWDRYIDSWDVLSECLDELEEEKILPRTT